MATVFNTGGLSSMSNAQQGTRGLSSSDLTRLKRLQAIGNARSTNSIKGWNQAGDGAPTNLTLYNSSLLIPRTTGSSRIRNTGSDWTAYRAFLTADQVSQRQAVASDGTILNGVTLSVKKLCSACGVNAPYSVNKTGICVKCVYDPKWQVTK